MRRGPKNLRITFDADALTHYGGAVLVYQFLQRIGLRSQLAWSVWFRQRNNRYQISETVLAVLYPVILGMERLGFTESLRHNGVFQYLTGLPGYPDATSLRRFLRRFSRVGRVAFLKLHNRYRQAMLASLRRHPILDLDGTVLTVYGHQRMAEVSYNPRKRGRPSYHAIFCFEGHIYHRFIFLPLLLAALALYPYAMYKSENNEDIGKMIAALCGALFVCCMVCHGELALRKPHPRYLTQFYLMVSVGGAAGGLFVALLAPHFFPTYLEMPIAVAGCALLVSLAVWKDTDSTFAMRVALPVLVAAFAVYQYHSQLSDIRLWLLILLAGALWMVPVRYALLIMTFGFILYLGRNEREDQRYYAVNVRNFYGVLHVRNDPAADNTPPTRVLVHGTINHGTQLLTPDGGRIPTSYFGRGSGIARAIAAKGDHGPIRIGILGMGAGVTASLARAGDTLHYYEINPLVPQISSGYVLPDSQFDFFRSCPADKRIFMGDGRLVLESLPSEQLDFLAMDAFTSDAVPIHLLTREAYQIYLHHLKPDGVLGINISNRYLDLEPVVTKAAEDIGWSGVTVSDDGNLEPFYTSSTWMILSPKQDFFSHPNFQDPSVAPMHGRPEFRAWTDDYSNIVKISISLPAWLRSILP